MPHPPAGRYLVVAVTAVAAMWMYIDRVCVSTVAGDIQRDLGLTKWERGFALGAFFVAYALFQVPAGSLADRWGPRRVLAGCIVGWSVVTALTGLAGGFLSLLFVRLLLGAAEAGAYPAAAGLVKEWAGAAERGRFSGVVAAGGRIGGSVAPYLTRWLSVVLVGVGLTWWGTSAGADGEAPARNWRGVFLVYGLCGLAVAALFWLAVRDRPPGAAAPPAPAADRAGWVAAMRFDLLCRSRNMWLFGAMQFAVNLGWAFLITKLPEYLDRRLHVPDEEVAAMQSAVLGIGATGMLFGGFATDLLRRKLGPRLGRSLPLGITLLGCAAASSAVAALSDPWTVVCVLGAMAFLVDLGNPAIWSFAQDVGGRNVGASLGWGNMWGNLGAAVSPVLLTLVEDLAGWPAVFLFCGVSFVAAAGCGLKLDASKPLERASGVA